MGAPLAPLETLHEAKRGKALPLPRKLARLYGRLRMPTARARPHLYSNFVTTLDGVVSLNVKGHASGGDISGFSAQDRMVMASVGLYPSDRFSHNTKFRIQSVDEKEAP